MNNNTTELLPTTMYIKRPVNVDGYALQHTGTAPEVFCELTGASLGMADYGADRVYHEGVFGYRVQFGGCDMYAQDTRLPHLTLCTIVRT